MKVKKISLFHFRHFEHFSVEFDDSGIIAIVGNNGAGKTTILDSIAICLTHFTGELLSSEEGYSIDAWFQSKDITVGHIEGFCEIDFNAKDLPEPSKIKVIKKINEKGLTFNKTPNNFILNFRKLIQKDKIRSIPIIAYYNVNRTYDSEYKANQPIKTYNKMLFAYERSLSLRSPSLGDFEKWFIEQQAIENSYKIKEKDLDAVLPSLEIVRRALDGFLQLMNSESYSEIFVKQESNLYTDFSESTKAHLAIRKDDVELLFSQMSHGERMIIGLVCEIARRLFLANPTSNPLDGQGVILIDELELHLHPRWQSTIAKALTSTFPNLQFIVTTHSPLILSGLRKESIKIIAGKTVVPSEELPNLYSATSNEILDKLMFAPKANTNFDEDKREIDILFNELKIDEAEKKLKALKLRLDADPEWLNDLEQKISFAKN